MLTSFQRRLPSLEAGVKYLIIGALSTAFTVFGIALVYGISAKLNFGELAGVGGPVQRQQDLFVRIVAGAGGAGLQDRRLPVPNLGAGCLSGRAHSRDRVSGGRLEGGRALSSCCACFSPPCRTSPPNGPTLLIIISGITILYGNLCAIPQRNLKRLLGYSSIAHAGYMLLGIAALSAAGRSASSLLPERLPVHGARRVHRHLPRDAAGGRRRHQRPGGPEPTLAPCWRRP